MPANTRDDNRARQRNAVKVGAGWKNSARHFVLIEAPALNPVALSAAVPVSVCGHAGQHFIHGFAADQIGLPQQNGSKGRQVQMCVAKARRDGFTL